MQTLKRFSLYLVLMLSPLLGQAAMGDSYTGTVNHIYDNNTLRMSYQGGQIRVQLAGIPEGTATTVRRQNLHNLVYGREVTVEALQWDRGTLIGRVYMNEERLCEPLGLKKAD